MPNIALPQLRGTARAEGGKALIVGPGTPREAVEYELEPLRVLGWPGSRLNKPLLHAKVLVLGELQVSTYGPDEWPDYFVAADFAPQSVWWGSANWTNSSRRHLEVGVVCDDPSLIREATDFVATVISHSEPIDAKQLGPQRNLLDFEYDDAAMAEASEEQYLAYLEAEEQREEGLGYFDSEDADED